MNFAQNLHLNSALGWLVGVIQFAGSCAKLLLESGWYDNCAAALTQHAFCLLAQLPELRQFKISLVEKTTFLDFFRRKTRLIEDTHLIQYGDFHFQALKIQ